MLRQFLAVLWQNGTTVPFRRPRLTSLSPQRGDSQPLRLRLQQYHLDLARLRRHGLPRPLLRAHSRSQPTTQAPITGDLYAPLRTSPTPDGATAWTYTDGT